LVKNNIQLLRNNNKKVTKNYLQLYSISKEDFYVSPMAVFKEKAFAIFTVKGFVTIAGAEFGKVSQVKSEPPF
jgi:hypothetical protein